MGTRQWLAEDVRALEMRPFEGLVSLRLGGAGGRALLRPRDPQGVTLSTG
jgi:hypothetical protein